MCDKGNTILVTPYASGAYDHGRNFVVKCGGGGLVWSQYSHRVDAEVTFCIYRFSILFLKVFWEQH